MHTVETILISVISMLADPNDESPANVDAAVSLFVSSSSIRNHAAISSFLLLLSIISSICSLNVFVLLSCYL